MAQVLRLSSRRERPRERHAVRTLTIDHEPVTVLIDRLTVAELDTVAACDYPRGSSRITVDRQDAGQLTRIAAIDRHLQPAPGEVVVDGVEQGNLGHLFGGRADIVARLYVALRDAQSPSAVEREALSVAARFAAYLADAPPSEWTETGTNCDACRERKLCKKRHCDGTPGKRVVWHDTKHVLKTCPVLAFTPETERVLRLFTWTHELAVEGPGVLRYRRVSLPAGPALGDQEAWTIAALDYVRGEQNAIMSERAAARKPGGASRG